MIVSKESLEFCQAHVVLFLCSWMGGLDPWKERIRGGVIEAVYHVMSRTALDGFVLGDVEKDLLLQHIRRLANVYFTEVLGFCFR